MELHRGAFLLGLLCLNSIQHGSSLLNGANISPQLEENMAECYRECDGVPKTCYMKLHIERYTVLGPACKRCELGEMEDCGSPQCITADGYQRSIITVNRQLPAPAIQVCRNDIIIVDVHNQMPDHTTTIHWHGVRQNGSQYFDGVPYVTQCPIMPGAVFRYIFLAEDPGTYFYHSHTGAQKLDGVSGPLIIRDEKKHDVQGEHYDEDLAEHNIFIQDWTHIAGEHLTPGLHSLELPQRPTAFLINGKGQYYNQNSNLQMPLHEFVVEKNKRYRFRIVGATCMTCPVLVRFEQHRVTAISSDGGLTFQPTEVDSVMLNPADRFDVVLTTNKEEGIYFITVQGVGVGSAYCASLKQAAVLRYKDSSFHSGSPTFASNFGVILNDFTSKCDGTVSNEICVQMLTGYKDAPKIASSDAYEQIEMKLEMANLSPDDIFRPGSYPYYEEPIKGFYTRGLLNNITFAFPQSPLLSQIEDIPENLFCSDECKQGTTTCTCAHVFSVPLNSVVDVIILSGTPFSHPYHLHGFNFHILEIGTFNDSVTELEDLKERLKTDQIDLSRRPLRDTISPPAGGYAAIRFLADNPGYWIVHCHFAFHLEGGMAAVVKVGDKSDLPPVPTNFPKCGNFLI